MFAAPLYNNPNMAEDPGYISVCFLGTHVYFLIISNKYFKIYFEVSVQWASLSLIGGKCRPNIHERGAWVSPTRDDKLVSFDLVQTALLLEDDFMACEEGNGEMAQRALESVRPVWSLYGETPFTTYQLHGHGPVTIILSRFHRL